MSSTPTWFQVARRPKWIGAFFLAMLFAAICAGFAQWQAGRSFEKAVTEQQVTEFKPFEEVLQPNEPAPQWAVGTQVFAELWIDKTNTYVIANRFQSDGSKGYWLVAKGTTKSGNHVVITLGFASTLEQANKVKVELAPSATILPRRIANPPLISGILMPSEAPQLRNTDTSATGIYNSLSIGQLANLWSEWKGGSYPLFLLVTAPEFTAEGLVPIKIIPPSAEVQINWLSAFYAVEWSVFCGFAFFLWWRLVRDQQLREAGLL